MAQTKVTIKWGALGKTNLDLSEEMRHAGDLVAQEMRGNVKRGLGVKDSPLQPNKPGYSRLKQRLYGHSKPLIAKYRSLVTPANYRIKKVGRNHVQIGMVGYHPSAKMKIGQLAYIHNFGLGNNPVREFAGVTNIAVKRIVAFMNDRIARLLK